AQHNDKVGMPSRQVFPFHQLAFGTEFLNHGIYRDRVSVGAQPVCDLARHLAQVGLAVFGDDGSSFHQNSACRKNSRFPSMPKIGDSMTSTSRPPSPVTATATFATALFWTSGSRTIPPLPTSSRPASNCGFTSTSRSRLCGAFNSNLGSPKVAATT